MSVHHSDEYVLLPRHGLKAAGGDGQRALISAFEAFSGGRAFRSELPGLQDVVVLDSVSVEGPKLVRLGEFAAAEVNDRRSPLRAIPVTYHERPDPRPRPLQASVAFATVPNVQFHVTDRVTGNDLADAEIIAFTDFARRVGDSGITGSNGRCTLALNGSVIERLYVYPPPNSWGAFRSSLTIRSPISIALEPVDLSYVDGVRHYYPRTKFDPQTGVTVGVVDTGVGPHGNLNLVGGANTVAGEVATDFEDGGNHGTHVAGLIGADGAGPTGLRGMAPGVPIRSYRVFGAGSNGASNYAILKAMIFAAQDGCDIVNLSLGGGPYDAIVEEAIADARSQGMLVVVAAGNDGRGSVNYPAAYPGATAVSAMGREGTFPSGSLDEVSILRPPASSKDQREFIADFSNVGPQIHVTAPGVGVLSTLPRGAFGPMSGTSMSSPVVAGAAAALLSNDPSIFLMQRDAARSSTIEKLLLANCDRRGFGVKFEGHGIPDPAQV